MWAKLLSHCDLFYNTVHLFLDYIHTEIYICTQTRGLYIYKEMYTITYLSVQGGSILPFSCFKLKATLIK